MTLRTCVEMIGEPGREASDINYGAYGKNDQQWLPVEMCMLAHAQMWQ